jgi:chemotaxis protein methyltransferase CheR
MDLKAVDGIIDLVYERSRIRLNRGKEALIRARLGKRMRALGLATLPEYWAYLCSPAGSEEVGRAIDALTTNFTQFLRERDHFDYMVAEALPRMLGQGQRRFSVWSAACATGEEPYTIAFQLSERFPPADGWDWTIHATDISSRVLETAQRGVYPEDRMSSLPGDWVRKFFQRGFGSCEGLWRVKAPVRQRITFERMNLLDGAESGGNFEIIFCRNVMIYFDRPTQERLANRLSRALVSGGYLFTGRAESLNGLAMPLRCLRPSIYQKPN